MKTINSDNIAIKETMRYFTEQLTQHKLNIFDYRMLIYVTFIAVSNDLPSIHMPYQYLMSKNAIA
jgi:hypothetical protein